MSAHKIEAKQMVTSLTSLENFVYYLSLSLSPIVTLTTLKDVALLR